jgi:radical SAM protein with 4Fe4S-binding SPASM domain
LTVYGSSPSKDFVKAIKQYYINNCAYEILMLINGTNSLQDIVRVQTAKYNDNPKHVFDSVVKFISDIKTLYNIDVESQDVPVPHSVRKVVCDSMYPVTASIELTYKCNIRCRHCYGNYNADGNEMPPDDVIRLLHDLHDIGVRNVEFTGGEISTYTHLHEVLEEAFKLNFNAIVLLTNGINISNDVKELLNKNSGRVYMQIDLHSLDDGYLLWFTGHSGYTNSIISNIKYAINAGIKLRVATIVTKKNLHEINKIADIVSCLGVSKYATSLVVNMGRASGNQNLFLDTELLVDEYIASLDLVENTHPKLLDNAPANSQRSNCGCVTTNVVINPSGGIKLCSMDGNILKIGNVFTSNIKLIYDENKALIKDLFYLNFPKQNDKECKECTNRPFCSNCIVRTLIKVRELRQGGSKCAWFEENVPRRLQRFFNAE